MMRHMTDTELIDKIDAEIFGENRLEIFEEDGGCIILEKAPKFQNCYVGETLREALTKMVNKEQS